jgi:tetratricopeptide (TPR) repeat protein
MYRGPRTYKITNKNVEFYEAKKPNLTCSNCLVRPSCFYEKKATKRSKHLRYTVELKDPCIEALLKMELTRWAADDTLVIPVKKMHDLGIKKLFDDAVYYFHTGHSDFLKAAYLMFITVIEKDPQYISEDSDTAYQYLAMIFEDQFEDMDSAIKLYSKSIDLAPKDSLCFENRGFCYLKKKELKNGLADLKRAKSMNGGYHPDLKNIIDDLENRIMGITGNSAFDSLYE